MNIQNIQIAPNLLRTAEGTFIKNKENVSSENDASVPGATVSEKEAESFDNRKLLSGDRDLMQIVYPPFFPIGETQSFLSIEAVKLTGENEKSAASINKKELRAIQQKEIDNNRAKNAEDSTLQYGIATIPDVPTSDKTSSIKFDENPGVVVDLTV